MQACTIIARNYLAHARVLAASFAEHDPGGRFSVMVIDGLDGYADAADEPFEVLTPADIGLDVGLMATRYDVLELSTAVKPWLLRFLLQRDDHAIYLDPDIQLFSSLEPVAQLAREHGVVLTPHLMSAMPRDGRRPNEQDILMAGIHNLGFLALGAGDAVDALLDWWEERLEHDCIVDPSRGFFVDQRWMDFIPGLVPGTHLLRDPGYNVAYWNLHGRELSQPQRGSFLVNDEPLRFMHFSGYDPRRPDVLSKHQNRIALDDPVLRELADEYGRRLLAAGYEEAITWPYGYGVSASGLSLTRVLRRAHAAAVVEGELSREPFEPEGEEEFFAWLAEPASVGGDHGITRYMYAVYSDREDLQRAYPDVVNGDAAGMIGWFQVEAGGQMAAPPGAVPPLDIIDAPDPQDTLGVNVVGYLRSEHGVGEVSRQAIRALSEADVPVLPIGEVAAASRQGHAFEHHDLDDARYAINLLCVNADQTPELAERAGPDFFDGRHTIGWWWWEVETFPERWMGSFDVVDEVWAGSRFVAETLSRISPVPVVYVPMPVELPEGIAADRPGLGLPEGFLFLFTFDYHSVFARKNPLGVVEAFRAAFPEATPDGPLLVIKSINGEDHPAERARLAAAVAGRPDIILREDYLDVADKNALMASCDCYVSLHRSEGFGITIAEAMLLGRPVIATDYSGATDLLGPDRAFPIRYERRPIGPGSDPYPADGVWAEPDLTAAAEAMVAVVADPDAATARGFRGRAHVLEHHSAAAAGRVMRERLKQVQARRRRAAGKELVTGRPSTTFDHIDVLLRRGPSRSGRSRLDPRRWIRAISLRLSRPQAAYQHEVDAELTAAITFVMEEVLTHVDRRDAEIEKRVDALRRSTVRFLADHAAADAASRTHLAGLQEFVDRLPDVGALERELRATPYVSGTPFTLRVEPHAGTVLGYRGGEGQGELGTYTQFENVFRGSRALILERQRPYLAIVGEREPVLDAGCGRGEFLDLLREAGLRGIGVDADPGMVALCRSLGHDEVHEGDVVSWLDAADDGSLGAIFCAQVVEHLTVDRLEHFLQLARRKLRADGVLIAETVNPHALSAMKTFWVDLTHQHPIFPEVLLQLCRSARFADAYVFHVNGTGEYDADSRAQGEYAVVARPGS